MNNEIAGYQKRIQSLCSKLKVCVATINWVSVKSVIQLIAAVDTNFEVHKISETLAGMIPLRMVLMCLVFASLTASIRFLWRT